ncbi:uncharacterized protein DS421_16g531030 [Arachis hypogaea]|nr:uncharacterized protein DS421_16g531030 [Arachis hypogaea]
MIYSNGRFLKVSEKSGMGTSRWRCSQIQARNQVTIDLLQQSPQHRCRPAILLFELCCFAVLFSNPPFRVSLMLLLSFCCCLLFVFLLLLQPFSSTLLHRLLLSPVSSIDLIQ